MSYKTFDDFDHLICNTGYVKNSDINNDIKIVEEKNNKNQIKKQPKETPIEKYIDQSEVNDIIKNIKIPDLNTPIKDTQFYAIKRDGTKYTLLIETFHNGLKLETNLSAKKNLFNKDFVINKLSGQTKSVYMTATYNSSLSEYTVSMSNVPLLNIFVNTFNNKAPKEMHINFFDKPQTTLTNVKPQYNKQRNCYYNSFDNNRLTRPSIKNFIIKNNLLETLLQSGSIEDDNNIFVMDISDTISIDIAFAISLCSIIL
jgi:hypothetical protein